MSWLAPLDIPLIRQAFIGLIVAGSTLSLLGVIILNMNLAGIRFTLMHVGLLGAAISLSLGVSPTLGAFIMIMLVSALMGTGGERLRWSPNALSGFFMTGSLALAFLVLARAGVPAMEVFSIFAGSVLILTRLDLWFVIGLGLLIIGIYWIGFREIQLILLDQDLANNLGVPVPMIKGVLFLILGASVALALRLVGALLVDSLILLPAMAAMPLSSGLKSALVLTSLFGCAATTIGFLLALRFDLPVGASVAMTGTIIMGISFIIHGRKRR